MKTEQAIWSVILQSTFKRMRDERKSEMKIETLNDLNQYMRTTELFPQKGSFGDHYRLGMVLFDVIRYCRDVLGLPMTITYPEKSEYVYFPTLEAIWLYITDYIDEIKS